MHTHHHYLQKSLEVAKQSKDKGNLPFGCILVAPGGELLLTGENSVNTDVDAIAHCEINLAHQLKGRFELDFLQQCTVYASTEPCPMCAAALFWSGIGRIVFALSKEGYHSVAQTNNPAHIMNMKAGEVLSRGGRYVEIIGPLLEEEAMLIYKDWMASDNK